MASQWIYVGSDREMPGRYPVSVFFNCTVVPFIGIRTSGRKALCVEIKSKVYAYFEVPLNNPKRNIR